MGSIRGQNEPLVLLFHAFGPPPDLAGHIPMKLTLKHAFAAITSLALSFVPPVAAVELEADFLLPENSLMRHTARLSRMLSRERCIQDAFSCVPGSETKTVCRKPKGLRGLNLSALLLGCESIDDDKTRAFCGSGIDKKLRPGFAHPGAAPPSAQKLTASEFVAIESGCPSLRDPEKARCLSGVKKLRTLLVGTLLPNALNHDAPALVTPQEYLRIVKAAPYWITSPRGD